MRSGHALSPPPGGAWPPVLAAACWTLAVLALGGAATDLGPWYQSLDQPVWKPPRAAFAPAWTAVLALAAFAGLSAWRAVAEPAARFGIVGLFLLNGLLNASWGVLFFVTRRPDWALVDLCLLWLSVLVLAIYCGRFARVALWCLLPYLLWVAYAGAINLAVVSLNGPFGGA